MEYLTSGERVGLGPLRRDLVADYTRWVNEPSARDGIGAIGMQTEETEAEWFERVTKAAAERVPDQAQFTIYDLADNAPVGTASLFAINHLHGTGTLGIMIAERRGQGLGTEAVQLVVRWAWDVLGLHNVMLTVLAWNEGAIRAYRRAGFEDLGVRRRSVWSRGERVDEVHMQAVRD
jgi:RimJ/RimL family protein N-acetyltransferase